MSAVKLADAGLGELRRQLGYKTTWYGGGRTWSHPQDQPTHGCGGRRRRNVNPAQRPAGRRSDGDRPSARRDCLTMTQKLMDRVTKIDGPGNGIARSNSARLAA
jgi:hypothetical protein